MRRPLCCCESFARRVELARLRTASAFCVDALSGSLQVLFLWWLIRGDLLQIEGVYLVTGLSCGIAAFGWMLLFYRGNTFSAQSVTEEMKTALDRWALAFFRASGGNTACAVGSLDCWLEIG